MKGRHMLHKTLEVVCDKLGSDCYKYDLPLYCSDKKNKIYLKLEVR